MKRYNLRDFNNWLKESPSNGHCFERNLDERMRNGIEYKFNYPREINSLFSNSDRYPIIFGKRRMEIVEEWMLLWEVEKNVKLEKEILELKTKLKLEKKNLEDFTYKSEEWHLNQLAEKEEEKKFLI